MENDFKKINSKCFICGNKADFWTDKQGYNLYKCRGCGLIFVYPSPKNSAGIYSADYFNGAKFGFGYVDYENDKKAESEIFEKYLNEIEKIIPQKGKLLDVGAATGSFLEAANRRGWLVSGVEISDYAAAKARQKNLNVQTGILENLTQAALFDVITLWDVLEHLVNPEKNLKIIYNLLKTDGIVAINTPNAGSFFAKLTGRRWHLLVPPEHLFYFNPKNLTRFLEKNGFEICYVINIGKKFTLQYVFQTLARWQRFFLWRWAANKLSNTPFGRFLISINLHDNLFIVARKK